MKRLRHWFGLMGGARVRSVGDVRGFPEDVNPLEGEDYSAERLEEFRQNAELTPEELAAARARWADK